MNTFIDLKLLALAFQNFLDTLSDVLVKCFTLLFNLHRVCLNLPSQATLGTFFSVVYTFLLKILSLVLTKN